LCAPARYQKSTTQVIVGQLRAIDGESFVLGGDLRVFLSLGVSIPDFPLGTSLTVVAVSHHDVLYAENISPTPADTLG
jgi:hypothetical protein